jgi:hypothetical protein
MLAEAIIENNEMKIINYSKAIFKGKHWKINIEPIEEIIDNVEDKEDFIAFMVEHPITTAKDIEFCSRTEANER